MSGDRQTGGFPDMAFVLSPIPVLRRVAKILLW